MSYYIKENKLNIIRGFFYIFIFLQLTNFGRVIFSSSIHRLINTALIAVLLIFIIRQNLLRGTLFKHIELYFPILTIIIIYAIKIIVSGNFGTDFYSPLPDMIELLYLFIFIYIGTNLKLFKLNSYKLLTFVYLLITISAIYSYGFLVFIDQYALRRGSAIQFGVSNFNLVYVTAFSPYLLFALKSKYCNSKYDIPLNLSWIILILFLLKSGFMIAVIFYILITIFLIISKKYYLSAKKIITFSLISIILVYVFRKIIAELIFIIGSFFSFNWIIQDKINAIGYILSGVQGNIDTLGVRAQLTIKSINTFFDNIIFGIPFSNFDSNTIGNHSFWFDIGAKIGISSILLLVTLYFLSRYYKTKGNLFKNSIIGFYLLLGFVNPILMPPLTLYIFTIMLPSSCSSDHKKFVYKKTSRGHLNGVEDPLISVIVPAFNSEETIIKTLESIRGQTYSQLEIIVVNDGSHDNTRLIVEKVSEIDSRIKLINKDNGGVSSARNIGIEYAKGEFICFLDSDDFYEPTFIEKTLDSEKDISVCCYNIFSNNQKIKVKNPSLLLFENTKEVFISHYLGRKIKVHTSNWIVSKKIIDKYNIRFNEQVNFAEDFDFFIRVLIISTNLSFTRESLTNYKVDQEETLSSPNIRNIESEILVMSSLIKDTYVSNSKLITRMINEYRIPATTTYTLLQLFQQIDNQSLQNVEVPKVKLSLVNGLRSVKLFFNQLKLNDIIKKRRKEII